MPFFKNTQTAKCKLIVLVFTFNFFCAVW